jgi:hypothetical protein
MKLKWTPQPGALAVEGWPADDHDEPDAELAKAKIESGLYVADSGKASPPAAKEEE